MDYGFEPTSKKVHIFARKKRKSDFVDRNLKEQPDDYTGIKTATFLIPLTSVQTAYLLTVLEDYSRTEPYDYAFFGMRCASTTQDILGQIGVVKKRGRFYNITSTFYPKKLRKRMFRLALKKNYRVIKTEGRLTRKWERD